MGNANYHSSSLIVVIFFINAALSSFLWAILVSDPCEHVPPEGESVSVFISAEGSLVWLRDPRWRGLQGVSLSVFVL